ncbi:MAG: translation initiation factor 3, partial [Pseudomonadota bacterium]
MRNLIWIVVAVVIAGGAYFLFTGQSPQQVVNDVTDAATDVASDAADAVTDTTSSVAETATDAAETAVEAATDAA